MNWEAIGAMGETVGAMLVLITLIYLATQVRYAKNTAADANRLARARGVCDMQLALVGNDQLLQSSIAANGQGDIVAGNPLSVIRMLTIQVGIGNADLLKAELQSNFFDGL